MLGIGFDLNKIDEHTLTMIDIINVENPMYSNYLNTDFQKDITTFLQKNYGKEIITDGCYIDLNPAATEQGIRKIVKETVEKSIAFAKAIGSSQIVFLSTYLPMIGLSSYEEDFIDNAAAFWKEILKEEKQITISLCNTFEHTPDVLLKLRKKVGSERFTLAMDIGHAFAYGTIPVDKFYKQMEPYVDVVYIHSNNKQADEHLNLWQGKLLEDTGFQKISGKMGDKKIILKPFDKKHLIKNILSLRQSVTSMAY